MKKNKPSKPKVNPELDGFEMSINSFGEIKSSIKIDEINAFLNKNVADKKLKGREDIKDQNSGLDE